MKQINFNNALRAIFVTLTLTFMAVVSVSAQNWVSAPVANGLIDQELNKLATPTKTGAPAGNTLTTTQPVSSPTVSNNNSVIEGMKVVFLMEVQTNLKKGMTTEEAVTAAFTMQSTPTGTRATNFNTVKAWVIDLLS